MKKFTREERMRALLVEYTATQNSAQHHDSLVWITTGMIWSAELVLIGFVMQSISNPLMSSVSIFACILAIVLLVYLWLNYFSFRTIRYQKYERCKKIERILYLKQHTTLKHKERLGFYLYNFVMIMFSAMWILIISTLVF